MRVQSLSWEEKEMATYSSVLAWRIPWTEELGGLQSMGSQRAGHMRDWVRTHTHTHTHTELARQHALLRCWIPSSRGTLSPGRWMVIPRASLLSPLTHRQLLPLLSALVISLCEISSSFFYLSFPDWTPTDTIPSTASCNMKSHPTLPLQRYGKTELKKKRKTGKFRSFGSSTYIIFLLKFWIHLSLNMPYLIFQHVYHLNSFHC